MNDERSGQGNRRKKNPGRGGGDGSRQNPKSGGQQGQKKQQNKKRTKKKSSNSAIDSKRPMWENPKGEAQMRELVGSVRPANHPTAVVRSLGDPPLGKYATNAQHYYDAVYAKAQQFAVAMAAANGLLEIDELEEADADDPEVTATAGDGAATGDAAAS